MTCCGRGTGRAGSTARIQPPPVAVDGKVPRVAPTNVPTRYVVAGKRFATMTAAQDYARSKPGAVIKQV